MQAELAKREATGGEAPRTSATVKDSVEVPVQARKSIYFIVLAFLEVIGTIIGSGGAAIKQLSAEPLAFSLISEALRHHLAQTCLRSGARMSFENEEYQPGGESSQVFCRICKFFMFKDIA